jgi:CheY-like chemotaxis protein
MGGFTVETCNSGEEAIKKAPAFNPDLILLDMLMPGMDGITTYQALRNIPLTASIPIIFLTAMVQPEEIKRYKELGAIEVIYKPFDPLTLCDTITQIWRQYHHG